MLHLTLAGAPLGVSNLYYSAGPIGVAVPGYSWTATGPTFDQDKAKAVGHWKTGLDVDQWQVVIAPRNVDPLTGTPFPDVIGTQAWLAAAQGGALDGAEVQVDRAFGPCWPAAGASFLAPTGIVTIFYGRVAELDVGRSQAVMTLNSTLKVLTNPLPRNLFQASCVHTLFDQGCTLQAASFAVAGTVTSASGSTLTSSVAAPAGSGTYALGRGVMISGASGGFLARLVRSWSQGSPASFHARRAVPVRGLPRRQLRSISRLRQAVRHMRPVPEHREFRRLPQHSRAGDGDLMGMPEERAAVVREALSWLGTAFHHRGRVKATRDAAGAITDRGGVDCAQSVYLICRAACPARVPEIAAADGPYGFQWNLSKATAAEEGYLGAVLDHAREIGRAAARAGDLALFRWGLAWAHGAIVMPPGWPAIAHANIDGGAFMLDRADRGPARPAQGPVLHLGTRGVAQAQPSCEANNNNHDQFPRRFRDPRAGSAGRHTRDGAAHPELGQRDAAAVRLWTGAARRQSRLVRGLEFRTPMQ